MIISSRDFRICLILRRPDIVRAIPFVITSHFRYISPNVVNVLQKRCHAVRVNKTQQGKNTEIALCAYSKQNVSEVLAEETVQCPIARGVNIAEPLHDMTCKLAVGEFFFIGGIHGVKNEKG